MLAHYPLVSFITVNYKSLEDTVEFLESAIEVTYPNIEIIVVDNNSPTGKPTEEIKHRFPTVKFIYSDKNLGFAGGNNIGLREAQGEYYFLLNNDTILFPDFLEPIIEFMLAHPRIGIASPKVLYPDGKTIQYAGAISINQFTGRGKRLGLMEKDHGQYDKNYQTGLGHGAALIIPKKTVEDVGLMPEVYFLYYEEHDWTELIKRTGYSMYYIGNSKIIHKESKSTGGDESPLKVFYMTRNRILFMRRNSSFTSFLVGITFFIFTSIPKHSIKFLMKGKLQLLNAYFRGIFWNIIN